MNWEVWGVDVGIVSLIHKNDFVESVLGNDGLYFESSKDVEEIIGNYERNLRRRKLFTENNLKKIRTEYNWDHVVDEYEKLFFSLL